MKVSRFAVSSLLMSALMLISPMSLAYLGPGAGLSAIGSLLALIGAVLFAIVGFLWFPVKRMLKRRKNDQSAQKEEKRSDQEPQK